MNSLITLLKKAFIVLLLLLGTTGFNKAFADHIAAVDLYADFIGPDSLTMKYRVTLVVYKNCFGTTTLGTSQSIGINSPNAGFSFTRNLPQLGPADTLDQLCPYGTVAKNRCRNPASIFPGYERRVYVDTITVPARSTDLRFSWSLCCRNAALNLTPTASNFYIECSVNNINRYNASTPRYQEIPIPYICVNQATRFLNDPYDPDMDSMYTTAIFPQSGYLVNLSHAPFSLANPVNPAGSPTPYIVNSLNGSASFTPSLTGNFVLAFRTYKYDRYTGAPLGYISRDAQISVLACAAPAPPIDSIPGLLVGGTIVQPGNVISICPNAKVTFDIKAQSNSGLNSIKFTSNNVTQAVGSVFTFVSNPGGVAIGSFSWTPTTADIGNHTIKFEATDTTCSSAQPILLKSSLTVTIRVLPGLDAGPDRKICPLGDNPVTLSVNGPPTNIYRWTRSDGGNAEYINCLNCRSVEVAPPMNYTYIVSTSDPLFVCKSSDTVLVTIDNSNGIKATQDPLVVCRPGYVTLTANPIGPNPVSNIPCGTVNPQNCNTPDQLIIGATGNVGNVPANTPFSGANKYQKYQFILTKQELKNGGLYSGTLKSIAFKSNNPVVLGNPLANLRISLKCTRNTRFPNVISNTDFETGTTLVATVPVYTIAPNAWNMISFTTPYNWDTTQNLLVDICMGDAAFVPGAAALDPVDMVPGQAIQRTSNTADICGANATDINLYTQRPAVRFDYCQAPDLPFNYQWAPGTYLSDSNIQNPVAYVPRSGQYAVFTWGRNGCKVRDSLHIIVPIHKLDLEPRDTSVCVGQPAQLRASGASAGYIWYEDGFKTPTTLSCTNCANPVAIADKPGDITYNVVFLDTAGCYDTLQITMHVHPLPGVVISNNDTTIKFGQHVNLMVTGANQYTWTPAGTLSDPNIPNPIATPSVTTDYIVFGISQYNCRSSDTVRINVDNRDNLLVPSGFTPNGDGKNDVFKIVNVTFQKLVEFRIFNRWGQEVFSTTDPTRGWDGTWKGVAQDIGSYSYLIRVAYPDGYSETYKGDVSLIR